MSQHRQFSQLLMIAVQSFFFFFFLALYLNFHSKINYWIFTYVKNKKNLNSFHPNMFRHAETHMELVSR